MSRPYQRVCTDAYGFGLCQYIFLIQVLSLLSMADPCQYSLKPVILIFFKCSLLFIGSFLSFFFLWLQAELP